MYQGYELGIVYIFDPAYIDWCINNIDRFYISDLEELKEIGVINESLDWQYRMIGDPSLIPNIDIFETFQEFTENVELGDRKYIFNEETLKINDSKKNSYNSNQGYDEEEEYGGYYDSDDYYESDDTCPACGGSEYMCCNYWIERNS